MGKLDGRTIVITGAARGQGAAEAAALVRAGAFVIATDIRDIEGKDLAASFGAGELGAGELRAGDLGAGELVYRHLDVSSQAEWLALRDWITESGRPLS